jgi:hypothetical protein
LRFPQQLQWKALPSGTRRPVIQYKFTDISETMLPQSAGWLHQDGGTTFIQKISKFPTNNAASYHKRILFMHLQ